MRAHRWLALISLAIALAAGGCTGGKTATTPVPSEQPTSTPGAESLADFQLVGSTQHAFVGVGPGIDTSAQPSVTSSPTANTTSTATFGTPGLRGVMRINLDDASDSLKTNCSAARDETIDVFWTTDTQFDSSLLTSDLESALEGKTVGVVGRLFLAPAGSDVIGEATPSPSASPGASVNPLCVLIADQIGTSTGTIPTAVPVATRFRTATPTRTPTPTPTHTPKATPTHTPKATATPKPSPTPTPT